MKKIFGRKSGKSGLSGLKYIREKTIETLFFLCGMLYVVPPTKVSGSGIGLSCGLRTRELSNLFPTVCLSSYKLTTISKAWSGTHLCISIKGDQSI